MRTRAAISALCLVEIKLDTHRLLKEDEYRSGVWEPSKELSGGVVQAQANVRAALDMLLPYERLEDDAGNPTSADLTVVQPRSFLIIGNCKRIQDAEWRQFPAIPCF